MSCGIGGLLLVSGCGNSNNSNNSTAPAPTGNSGLAGCADTDSCASNPTLSIGGERPAKVLIPSDYNTATRYPLAVVLHGYGATGEVEAIYLGLDTRVDTQQYILVMPDGTENLNGTRYWNATPGCCAFTEEEKKVDDVAYIRGLIEEAAATYSIDTTRIGLIGHSNGGFMALRLVCEASDLVTSVVSLAGSTFIDDANCAPATNPVSVLTMHGTADGTIFYDGGANAGQSYPGARETIARYAAHAGCDRDNPVMAPNTIDVIASIPGNETEVLQYTGCPAGIEVTLWTMVDGPHIPFPWVSSAIDSVVDWAIDHPRS
ncbi:MAG: alpha/beta hydrolase-fold protein [Halioglobus sp.]